MISQSYYNKYRPKTFKDIRGSKSAEILETQIKNNRTTHAYILAGPPGTGKTTLARVASAHLLCNDGQVFVSVMFTSTAQRLYKFTRSGTSAATGTLLDSNTLTASYGLDQGFQYGQRQITSRDGTTVAVFCPYYYYGSGIGCFMVNKATANYTKYSNTDSGYGTQVLPYRDNGWIFIYCGNGYAGNYTGNYIIGTWVPSTSVTANAAFTQMGSTKYFPAHTFPNTTNYPGFTQVVDYNALVPSSRGFK